ELDDRLGGRRRALESRVEQAAGMSIEDVEQLGRADDSHFEALRHPAPHVPPREAPQEGGIDDGGLGRSEAAEQALLPLEVDAVLHADACVDHADQGRRYAHVRDATAKERRGETADVRAY